MDQHVNVHQVCLEIHSQVVPVLQINAQPVIRVPIIKFVSVVVVSIVAKTLFAELALHANKQLENVSANHILSEIQTIYACHVSYLIHVNNIVCIKTKIKTIFTT